MKVKHLKIIYSWSSNAHAYLHKVIVGLFCLVFTIEAVNKESTHPPAQVKQKKWYGLSNIATLSQAFPGKSRLRPLSNIIPISYLNWAWMRVLCNRWILFKSPNRLIVNFFSSCIFSFLWCWLFKLLLSVLLLRVIRYLFFWM